MIAFSSIPTFGSGEFSGQFFSLSGNGRNALKLFSSLALAGWAWISALAVVVRRMVQTCPALASSPSFLGKLIHPVLSGEILADAVFCLPGLAKAAAVVGPLSWRSCRQVTDQHGTRTHDPQLIGALAEREAANGVEKMSVSTCEILVFLTA
ncbi:hypothetical protein HGM15179_017318 [Zosterops borbonicus]|uniref:Uncharacterized protein n=1 Tax=Zosterops borbonicus TaxID=364589 RepID=A0A8K1LDE8_9PASS|nr:hypothetical protein HGM15179_017318 [Zosterops borbonicus]